MLLSSTGGTESNPPERPTDTMAPKHQFDDPVAAYDRLAPHYSELSARRKAYLEAVEREIVRRIPQGANSLLDIGAGDSTRAVRIGASAGIGCIIAVEPSSGMSAAASGAIEIWPIRAEDLDPAHINQRFDVVTCLWNVLGHIPGTKKRIRTLRAVARLLAPQGTFFVDVTHRYNMRSYGVLLTSARWLHDLLAPSESSGDVQASWNLDGTSVNAYGHVFTHREIVRLIYMSELEIQDRIVIDYDDGTIRHSACKGNLLYVLRRSSQIDSSSAPQTS